MSSQSENTGVPEWAKGLSEEQVAAVRREAVRQGKRPAELVREWVLELARQLTGDPQKAA